MAVLLVSLLVFVFKKSQSSVQRMNTPVPIGEALKNHGFYLQEVSEQAGIHFIHQGPRLDPKLDSIMPEIASMGAAVSIVDYDRDGWPDIYVTNSGEGTQNHLYHNLHNGKFEDVAAKLGIADLNQVGTGVSMGAVWGDYDNDGFEDLLVYKWGKPELFHNDAGHGFTRVTEKAGLPKWVNANTATWVDYDRDGHLDLLICGYYADDVDLWHLKNTKMMPESFEYAANGGRKYLLRNRGDGTFEDVTQQMGINSHRWTLAAMAADLRGTGYPDLIMANDYGVTEVYANQQGHGFKEVGHDMNIGYGPKSGMNASVGDVTNQGRFSVYVSNISEPGNLIQGNNLWVPREGTSGDTLAFDNWATDSKVDLGGWSFGAQFGDLNNGGAMDLVLTNGFISHDKDKSYWYDFGKIAGGHSAIISDAKNWPPMDNMSLSGYEQKRIWMNDGFGKFSEVAQAVGFNDTHDGRSVALVDLWNQGVLDVVVANQNGPLLVYKNTVAPANATQWVDFDLTGSHANRSAIGAEVHLYWKNAKGQEQQQVQQVAAASG